MDSTTQQLLNREGIAAAPTSPSFPQPTHNHQQQFLHQQQKRCRGHGHGDADDDDNNYTTTSTTAFSNPESLVLVAASSSPVAAYNNIPHAEAVEEDDDGIIVGMDTSGHLRQHCGTFEVAEHDDDEEDDEYEYEDEDDAPFSGFLEPAIVPVPSIITGGTKGASGPVTVGSVDLVANSRTESHRTNEQPTTIRDDDPQQYQEEEEQELPVASTVATATTTTAGATSLTTGTLAAKWRQPSREAVNMSLRAEQETTGGKRRLAQDLYRIMNQDTKESGFSLEPASEDSMKQWTIKLFQFDEDSNLAKDMKVLALEYIELEMTFPDQYPFEPPFVRVVRPRFKRQTGFVMNGALCMELLTKEGWNPINDIESVIVSIRSLLVVGDGRLEAAYDLSETRYNELLAAASPTESEPKRQRISRGGSYTSSEAEAAYSHLTDYHKKKGWDTTGWWARKG